MKSVGRDTILTILATCILATGIIATSLSIANEPVMVRCEGLRNNQSSGCRSGCSSYSASPEAKIMSMVECQRAGGTPVKIDQSASNIVPSQQTNR